MKYLSGFVFVFLFVFSTTNAQETCEAIIQTAIETATQNCDGLGPNQVCYGNVGIDAEPAPDVQGFAFDSVGDIANVVDMASLQLSSDLTNGEYGISLMQLRASLPDESQDNATAIFFGNVSVENAVTSDTLDVVTNSRTRIRRTPDSSTDLNIIDALDAGTTLTAYGRSQSGDWLRVRWNGIEAWIGAITVDGDSERMSLPEVDFSAPFLGPMQSFYLSTAATTASDCADALPDGIVLQTPADAGTINFMINEVRVSIDDATAFVAVVDNALTVATLEGAVAVGAQNAEQYVPAGTQTSVLLTEDGRSPDAEPTDVTYYDSSQMMLLTDVLDLTPSQVVVEAIDESVPVEDVIAEARSGITPQSGRWRITVDSILTVEDTLLTSSHGTSACSLNVQVGFSRIIELVYDETTNTLGSAQEIAPGIFGATPAEHSAALAPNDEIEVSVWAETITFNSNTSMTWRRSYRNNWQGGDGDYRSACIYVWRGTYIGE